jgi:hypothetical protein
MAVQERWGQRERERQVDHAFFERTVLHPPRVSPPVRQIHGDAAGETAVEQEGAACGRGCLLGFADLLAVEVGREFNGRNLWFMRGLLGGLPIRNAVRSELTCPRSRSLACVEEVEEQPDELPNGGAA